MAVVRGRRGAVPSQWSSLVHPDRSTGAVHIHGLTDAVLADAPRWTEIADEVIRRMQGGVLVGHNVRFDLAFLSMEHARAGHRFEARPALDSLWLARQVLPGGRHGLASVAAQLGVPHTRAHRAEEDARACWYATWSLLDRVDPDHAIGLHSLARMSQPRDASARAALVETLRRHAGTPLPIAYTGAALTRRVITPTRVGRQRVEAWCHLRQASRVFRLDRIHLDA
jgi:DNA polymerase III epsilon subunit-like protein